MKARKHKNTLVTAEGTPWLSISREKTLFKPVPPTPIGSPRYQDSRSIAWAA